MLNFIILAAACVATFAIGVYRGSWWGFKKGFRVGAVKAIRELQRQDAIKEGTFDVELQETP